MDVTDIIALLRERAMVGRMEVRDKRLMIMAADMLEKQRELFMRKAKELSFLDNYGEELVAIAALEEMFGGENERD